MKTIRKHVIIGWLLAIVASTIYLLTMESSVSFWDCGEFIAVSSLLQVGHPPGAPFYQLLAHIFSLFAGSNTALVAACCNALSALSAGFTVMFLYWSILLLLQRFPYRQTAALVGSLCYLFCDTAWFSAVESEVYSLAMLIASVMLWAMLRWYRSNDHAHSARWLMLVALLLGLGYCTHQLALLTSPTLLLLFIFKAVDHRRQYGSLPIAPFCTRILPFTILFFLIGLTPYLIIPIRAAAGTPINEGNPATMADFRAYLNRDRYEKAPLYPRMWRHRENDALYAQAWNGGDTNLAGNLQYFASYQLTYMYLRYLMWNFSGRYNDRQGYGSPQNGQFLTGIPFIDRLLVGTAATPPDSLHTKGHNVYYLLPLLLGLLGLASLSNKRVLWTILSLFLMGGVILSLYLNHPCYEPRERDYAYILSFYAFCFFIGIGAGKVVQFLVGKIKRINPRITKAAASVLLLCIPLLMACQNWDDHNRSHRYLAHDAGLNILNSCDSNSQGAVLFCYGDNDTFPLWYLQHVEHERLDIRVENIGLMGYYRFLNLLDESMQIGRPVYFTHYAYNQFGQRYPGRLQLEGNCYRLTPKPCDSVATAAFYRHATTQMGWHPVKGIYVDEVSCKFLEMYWRDIVLLADNLADRDSSIQALEVLDKTLAEIPLDNLQDARLIYSISQSYLHAGSTAKSNQISNYLYNILDQQLAYFHTMSPSRQRSMPYTLAPKEELFLLLSNSATGDRQSADSDF